MKHRYRIDSYPPADVHRRITAIAKVRRLSLSATVTAILDDATRGIVVDPAGASVGAAIAAALAQNAQPSFTEGAVDVLTDLLTEIREMRRDLRALAQSTAHAEGLADRAVYGSAAALTYARRALSTLLADDETKIAEADAAAKASIETSYTRMRERAVSGV